MAAPPSAREHTLRSLVPSAAPRAWQPCRRHRGQPLTDADGQVLKAGSTVVNSKFGEGIARGTVPLEKDDGVTRANRRQQCWKATEPWHREPEAGVITAWLAAACTCAGRSMAGSLARLRTFSPTVPRPACSKSSTRIIWADGSKGPAKLSVENMAMGQMLATTHGQSYRAQSLWCERVSGLGTCPLITPHVARGFCHAVVLCLCQV